LDAQPPSNGFVEDKACSSWNRLGVFDASLEERLVGSGKRWSRADFLNWRCWQIAKADEFKILIKRSSLRSGVLGAGVGERRRGVAAVGREAGV
jgi:hypothetical protein